MKPIFQLAHALRMKQQGFCFSKAWQLAGFNVRKMNYVHEVMVIAAMCLAYAAVAWNDAELAHNAATRAAAQQVKAEVALVNLLNGKAMLVDEKTWAQCYSSTTM